MMLNVPIVNDSEARNYIYHMVDSELKMKIGVVTYMLFVSDRQKLF